MSDFYPQGVDICDVNEAITALRGAGCTGIGGVALSDYASDALGGDVPGFGGDETDAPRLILALAAEVVRQRRGMMEATGEMDALRARAQQAKSECAAWMDDAMNLREALDKANGKGTAAAVEATADLQQRDLERAIDRAEHAEAELADLR